jgi:hypothetical protein
MAEKRIAGTVFMTVDGIQYTLGGKMNVSPSLVEREGKVGLSGPAGYKESPRIPFVDCDLHTTDDLSISDLEDITNATVKVELANGRIYVFMEAWSTAAFEVDGAEGVVSVRFEAMDAEEL